MYVFFKKETPSLTVNEVRWCLFSEALKFIIEPKYTRQNKNSFFLSKICKERSGEGAANRKGKFKLKYIIHLRRFSLMIHHPGCIQNFRRRNV